MKQYKVIAYQSARSARLGVLWGSQEAGPFDTKEEARQVAKEQRSRRVYGPVVVQEINTP